jgi:hypothetical protein
MRVMMAKDLLFKQVLGFIKDVIKIAKGTL